MEPALSTITSTLGLESSCCVFDPEKIQILAHAYR
jgi:hypothetical protein